MPGSCYKSAPAPSIPHVLQMGDERILCAVQEGESRRDKTKVENVASARYEGGGVRGGEEEGRRWGRRGREGVGREEEVEPARGKDGEFMYAAAHGPRRQC